MKKLWKAKNDKEGVSPVIATILMVAITVVLAAILMVMVMGMTGDEAAPSATITATSTASETTVTVTFISTTTSSDKLSIKLDGTTITDNDGKGTWVGQSVSSGSVWTGDVDAKPTKAYLLYNGAVIASATIA